MKKLLVILLAVTLIATMAVGCTDDSEPAGGDAVTYDDGVYYAEEDAFSEGSGYKYFTVITVDGGQITDAYWGGTHIQPKGNKRVLSEEGTYGMLENGGAATEWVNQAKAAEAWLIENQDPAAFEELYTDEEGHTEALTTDDGATVSIHVIEFFSLAEKALASEPVAEGTYTTPADYVATATIPAEGDAEWEYRGEFVVVNGTIVSSNFNAVYAGEFNEETAQYFVDGDENSPSSKKELGVDYGMDWKANAEKSDAFVVETQGFEVEYNDEEGHTDTITGVSIHVNEFETLFNDALNQ